MIKPLRSSLALVTLVVATAAHAETLQMPEGGKPVPVGKDRVVCGEIPEGWWLSSDRRSVRPPEAATAGNRTIQVRIAAEPSGCSRSQATLALVAIGPSPEIDAASISFYPDEARLELKGARLDGMQVTWQAGSARGSESCLAATGVGRIQQCALPLPRKLPSSTPFRWLPAYAQDGADISTFDAQGLHLDPAALVLRPARVVVDQLFAVADTLDVSPGTGTVALVHPEALASVDCGSARCELSDGNVVVRNVPAQATQITISARLAPRFFVAHGDRMDTSASETFTLLRCPLFIQSGPPMRDVDQPHILIRMAGQCRSKARLRWFVGADPAEIEREVHGTDGDLILLRTGQLAGGSVTVIATRVDTLAGVVGSVSSPTMPPPRPQSTIELPGHGPLSFIPTNREAVWSVGGVAHARLVPVAVPGAYTVRSEKNQTFVRGEPHSGGYVNLRYAYRREDMPKGFEGVNLAIVSEAIERPLREASVPVPFTGTPSRGGPLAEFQCADKQGVTMNLVPGKPANIPYSARETCRVVIHQERLLPEDGLQEIVLEVDVTKVGGGKRSDASLSEHMVLHPGGPMRVVYLKGITEQYDQIAVRLSHVVDETRYLLGTTGKQTPPSAQWSAIVEGGRARLYVSLSVPAGLYRINAPAASLTLNFGVLGRITWLDRHGKEGLLGLETGVLGASLIPQQYNNSPAFPPTLVTLLGVGVRVEVGQGAAIGVHLWGAYEFRSEYSYTPSDGSSPRNATHWSLLFGPSISIGNVGTNL
jgi:hypothetical protein